MEKREETILQNIPLVGWVVNRLARDGDRSRVLNLERDDAWGFGVEGLMRAVDNYDATRGSTFASYAVTRIRGAILDASRKADPLTRHARQAVHLVDQAAWQLASEHGVWPTRQEIADALGLTAEAVARAEQDADASKVPWEALGNWAEPPDDGPRPDEAVRHREDVAELTRAMATLPWRDGAIIELHYRQGLPFKAVGAMLGISESRVCGLHKRALSRLRDALGRVA